MSTEIKVPTLPESIADATVVTWHKQPGDEVTRDEVLVDIETDKVVLEVPASEDGVLGKIIEEEGATVTAHQVIGSIEAAGEGGGDAGDDEDSGDEDADEEDTEEDAEDQDDDDDADDDKAAAKDSDGKKGGQTSPVVRKLIAEHDLSADDISGTGKNGRITKADVEKHIAEQDDGASPAKPADEESDAETVTKQGEAGSKRPSKKARNDKGASGGQDSGSSKQAAKGKADTDKSVARPDSADDLPAGERTEKRVPMTRLRKRIAERLLQATQTTAMLTTFNEVNMQGFIDVRNQYKDAFEKTHGVKLGFMSIFLKASTEALKRYPDVNASIDGDEVVYHGFCDIGVAVSSERGLVVPVLRNTEAMSLADMEKGIGDYAVKAREGKLAIEDMTGGTFTVSNGGVFGSLLSTPILNPPQSAILGMHATQPRPVAENGQVVIRPMMYIALSYDHRIVDGKGAVGFLKTIKELVEDPARIVMDL